jgi:hypothetical protein
LPTSKRATSQQMKRPTTQQEAQKTTRTKEQLRQLRKNSYRVNGTAPNTKQQGIFRILGENCNGFNNRIGGNNKIAKAMDIKEDLDIDCLLYCKHRLNFRHKDNKNDRKQMFQLLGRMRNYSLGGRQTDNRGEDVRVEHRI